MLAAQFAYVVVSTGTGLTAWLRAVDDKQRAAVMQLLRDTNLVARGPRLLADPARSLVEQNAKSAIDVLACSSAPAIRHLFLVGEQMGRDDDMRAALRNRVAAATIGPITARAFESEGVPVAMMPTRARSGDFVRVLASWAERPDPSTGPLQLLPWNRAVRVGPRVVVLGPQQFDVLAALVRRPGVVCQPGTLALEAFGYAMPEDSTAVRHHVSRIRRKLGAYGKHIETVRSVGYRYPAS